MREAPDSDQHALHKVPTSVDLRQTGVVGHFMKELIAIDQSTEQFHNRMIIHLMARRYICARAIQKDSRAFKAFVSEQRIGALKRPLKGSDDTLRALCHATILDGKLASKRFKRVEHLWKDDKPVCEVIAFLERFGWERSTQAKRSSKNKGHDAGQDSNPAKTQEPVRSGNPKTTRSLESEEIMIATIRHAPPQLTPRVGDYVLMGGTVTAFANGKMTISVAQFEP